MLIIVDRNIIFLFFDWRINGSLIYFFSVFIVYFEFIFGFIDFTLPLKYHVNGISICELTFFAQGRYLQASIEL
jgi:hypothetical protein